MTRKNTFQTNEFNGPKGGAKTDIEWISKEEWVDLDWVWYRTWAILLDRIVLYCLSQQQGSYARPQANRNKKDSWKKSLLAEWFEHMIGFSGSRPRRSPS